MKSYHIQEKLLDISFIITWIEDCLKEIQKSKPIDLNDFRAHLKEISYNLMIRHYKDALNIVLHVIFENKKNFTIKKCFEILREDIKELMRGY